MDIKNFGRFLCRTTYFPVDELDAYKQAGSFDEYLGFFFGKKEFLEALYIASPDFLTEVELYLSGEDFGKKRLEKFRVTALKYILRMCARPTPFGSFSGCSTGYIGNETQLRPALHDRLTLITRLDMGFLISLSEHILMDAELRKQLVFYPNNTIYEVNGQKRYVEFFSSGSGERFYNLASFEINEVLEDILSHFSGGGAYGEIVDHLRSDELEEEEIVSFINELIDAKILISELEPVMTGVSYHDQLAAIFREKSMSVSMEQGSLAFFKEVCSTFQEIDVLCTQISQPGERSPEMLKQVVTLCKKLPVRFPVKHYFQVDSIVNFATAPTISEETVRQIEEGVRFFTKLTPQPTKTALSTFRNKFKEKYGDRVIKLTELLDPDLGIGYTQVEKDMLDIAPFVDDLPMSPRPGDDTTSLNWRSNFHGFLLNRIIEAHGKKETVIELRATDMETFPVDTARLPATFNAFVTLDERDKSKPLIYFHNIGASSSICLLGRFGFMDNLIKDLVSDLSAYESSLSDDYVLAEVNHLSETRIGNVMLRPSIRPYEITYLTKSNAPDPSQILVDDLLVAVRKDKFVLYSEKLNKQVVPRLSNAHNYHKDTLPVYKFLCDIQDQNAYSDIFLQLFIDIGSIPALVNFIPRIQYKQFIYYPATWFFTKAEIQFVYQHPDDERIGELCRYMKERLVPERFCLKRGDTELYIDMNNPYAMQVFMSELINQTQFTISEAIPADPGTSAIRNEQGGFAHELLIPIHKTVHKTELLRVPTDGILKTYRSSNNAKRLFLPGDEWLYLKLYGGLRYNEKFLRFKLKDIVALLKGKHLIDGWFFLRYADPDSQIRLRFKLADPNGSAEVLGIIRQQLAYETEHGIVRNIIIDSYDRELERYNPSLMDESEHIFEADSDLCLSVLSHPEFAGVEANRWYFCLAVIDRYLTVFKLTEKERYGFIKEMRDQYAQEFNASKIQRRHLTNKYRQEKEAIDGFMNNHVLASKDVNWMFDELDTFASALELIYARAYGQLPLEEKKLYLNSFIHMFIIRFVVSKNRLHEYSLYSLLEQHYRYSLGHQLMINDED
jgi:thiopeptide-type bacteriocin biosynthesis protein